MINWDEAPEGTTHSFPDKGGNNHWRKMGEHDVFYWNDDEWEPLDDEDHTNPEEWEEKYVKRGLCIAKPAPVEVELPEGKVWPEGADFYLPAADAFFRIDEPAYQFGHLNRWSKFTLAGIQEYAARPDTIHRFPGAQPKTAPKEEPPKKRAVGWWN